MIKIHYKSNVHIDRCHGGIPLIQTNNKLDSNYGLGYCHAVDRGMQLILMKILGTGTASEHLAESEEMFEIDKFFRRMNWNNNILDELDKLGESENMLLQAYCDGINLGFNKIKPWEFKILMGYKDFHWTKQDCILIARMSGYLTLAQSQGEFERLFIQMVQRGINREMLLELFPNAIDQYDEALLKQIKLGEKIVPDAVKWNLGNISFMASNNWFVSGDKSQSGSPMLANDPHLEINRLPAVWYEVAIQLDDTYVHGATMPGMPSIIIGRNNDLAWGVTYAFMDATDSWIEKCKNGKYLKGGEWHDFTKREEIIKRKKAKPVAITFFENQHGVLDGDPYTEGYYLCTKWSGDRSGSRSMKSGFDLGSAQSVKEGMAIAARVESAFSWVFADIDGNIGYQMSGLMPKRREGVNSFLPVPGWLEENNWQGYHVPGDLPRDYNPTDRFIITANNDLNHLGNVNPINCCMGDYRANRIKQIIQTDHKFSVEDFQKMQYDTYSLQAKQFMKIIVPLLPESESGTILKEWDMCYDIDSRGAFLFEMIYRGLFTEVFGNVLGDEVIDFLQNETGIIIDLYQNFDAILLAEKATWFGDRKRDEIYRKAIDSALQITPRKWGDVNRFEMTHVILGGKLPKIFGFDKGPFPLPGGRATIHQGQIYKSAGRVTSFAPSFRLVTDMAKSAVYTNLAGGVSDRRFSSLYHNDYSNWASGFFKKIEF